MAKKSKGIKFKLPIGSAEANIEKFNIQFKKASISSLVIQYKDSGNPLFLWEIISICLENNFRFPEVVRDYLLNISSNIKNYSELNEHSINEKLVDSEITKSEYEILMKELDKNRKDFHDNIIQFLKLKSKVGGDSILDNYHMLKRRFDIAVQVKECIDNGNTKGDAITAISSKLNMNRSTVRDAYDHFELGRDYLDQPLTAS